MMIKEGCTGKALINYFSIVDIRATSLKSSLFEGNTIIYSIEIEKEEVEEEDAIN